MSFLNAKASGNQRFLSFTARGLVLCMLAMILALPGCEGESQQKVDKKKAKEYFTKAEKFRKDGNDEKALENYTKAIKINPNYTKAYINRAYIHEIAGRTDQAIKDYRKVMKLDKKNVECADKLALFYRQAGDSAKAEEYEREATVRREASKAEIRKNADAAKQEKAKKKKK